MRTSGTGDCHSCDLLTLHPRPTERIIGITNNEQTKSVDPQGGPPGNVDDESDDDDEGDKKIAATVNKEATPERQLVKRDTIWQRTCYGMRNEETVERYLKLMAALIQGVVTFKRFKMNRTIKPFKIGRAHV